jgi:hypothetical protein
MGQRKSYRNTYPHCSFVGEWKSSSAGLMCRVSNAGRHPALDMLVILGLAQRNPKVLDVSKRTVDICHAVGLLREACLHVPSLLSLQGLLEARRQCASSGPPLIGASLLLAHQLNCTPKWHHRHISSDLLMTYIIIIHLHVYVNSLCW